MSKHATELSALLVGEIYGELYSVIYHNLLRYGRLGLGSLVRRLLLPPLVVKSGLAVLIQQGLVLHYTVGNGDGTSYEANWIAAYSLLRSGKTLQLVKEHLGGNAFFVMTELLSHGHLRIKDLETIFLRSIEERAGTSTNGTISNKEGSMSKLLGHSDGVEKRDNHGMDIPEDYKAVLDTTLQSLFLEGYIDVIGKTEFQPFADIYEEAEAFVMQSEYPNGMKSGQQEKDNLKQSIESRIRIRRAQKECTLELNQRGTKRDRDDQEQVARPKRLKIESEPESNGDMTWHSNSRNGDSLAHDDHIFQPTCIIGINHSQCMRPHRDSAFVHAAEVRVGQAASLVYKCLLQQLSHRSNRTRMRHDNQSGHQPSDDDDLEAEFNMSTISTEDMVDEVQDNILEDFDKLTARLTSSFRPNPNEIREKRKHYKPALSNGLSEDILKLSEQQSQIPIDTDIEQFETPIQKSEKQSNGLHTSDMKQSRVRAFDQYLDILVEDSYNFVQCIERHGTKTWRVEYKKVAAQLRQHELENIVCQRFGDMALRIYRFLRKRGKMDEKKIQASTLIKMKQVRATLSILHSAGYLELQEVPRDNSRQVSKNIYLWFTDSSRCCQVVLENTYQTISRCLQRARYERDQLRTLLDKANRSDVKEHPDEFLTIIEKATLREWKLKEEKLLVQVARLDELVAIFRDY